MTIGIYGLFSSKTKECLYVGQSINIEKRVFSHISQLKKQRHIRHEFNEWFLNCNLDESEIYSEILEVCCQHGVEMNNAEISWFNKLKPKFYGKTPSLKDTWTHSDEIVAKISEANKNKGKYDDIIVSMYKSGYSMPEISKVIPRSNPGIMGVLKRKGIERNGKGYLSIRELNYRKSKRKRNIRVCLYCKENFESTLSKRKIRTCSEICAEKLMIENNKKIYSVEDMSADVYALYKEGKYKSDIMYELNISYNFLNKCIKHQENLSENLGT